MQNPRVSLLGKSRTLSPIYSQRMALIPNWHSIIGISIKIEIPSPKGLKVAINSDSFSAEN